MASKSSKKPLTISDLEQTREALNLTQFDYGWLLGIDRGKYIRLINNPEKHLGHSEAALVRYLSKHFDDYPYHTVITPKFQSRASRIVNQLRETSDSIKPLLLGHHIVDPRSYPGLGALLLRSADVARAYEADRHDLTLSGARWATLMIHCFSEGKQERILTIIEVEALSHNVSLSELTSRGWKSRDR